MGHIDEVGGQHLVTKLKAYTDEKPAVVRITTAEYEANKEKYDASNNFIVITDADEKATYTDEDIVSSAISGATTVKAALTTLDTNKVTKVEGMGLSSTDYTAAEKLKLSGIDEGATKTIVDSALSTTSTNPVQNAIITAELNNKAAKATTLAGYGIEDAVQKEDGKSLISAEDLAQITTNKNDIAKLCATVYTDVTDRS